MTAPKRRPRRRIATWSTLPVPAGLVPVPAPVRPESPGLPDLVLRERFAEACRRMAGVDDPRPGA